MSEGDEPEAATFLLDLRDVKSWVEARIGEGGREFVLITSDGYTRIELTGGVGSRKEAAIFGAQRIAVAALDYAVGLAMLGQSEEPEEPAS
jgi:hypothetical protein